MLAEIDIPLKFLIGEKPQVRVIRTPQDPKFDERLTPTQLIDHVRGEHPIRGECVINAPVHISLVELLRGNQKFYRPHLTVEGTVDWTQDFFEVLLEGTADERLNELNRS